MSSQIPNREVKASIKLDSRDSSSKQGRTQGLKKLELHLRFHDDPILECNASFTDNTWELHCLLCGYYFDWPIRACPKCGSVKRGT